MREVIEAKKRAIEPNTSHQDNKHWARANGQVVIQTHSHKSELLRLIATGQFSSWSELHQQRRKLLSLPPYGSYAEVSGPEQRSTLI